MVFFIYHVIKIRFFRKFLIRNKNVIQKTHLKIFNTKCKLRVTEMHRFSEHVFSFGANSCQKAMSGVCWRQKVLKNTCFKKYCSKKITLCHLYTFNNQV